MTITGLAMFTEGGDGDLRGDPEARRRVSAGVGISDQWAVVDQVHGAEVVEVDGPGNHGPADGLYTSRAGLPLAVFTADCVGVVLMADEAIGVAHAGWRGAADGVVVALRRHFESSGERIRRAVIGPHIRSCCFEVGDEVAERFAGHVRSTSWGTTSVDLAGVIADQLSGIEVQDIGACTRHDPGWFSHRRDSDPRRLAAVAVRRSDV